MAQGSGLSGMQGMGAASWLWQLRPTGLQAQALQTQSQQAPGRTEGKAAPAAAGESIDPAREEALRQVSREFEALLLEILLKQARRGAEGLSGRKAGVDRQIYMGLLDQQVAQQVAAGEETGLSETLYRHLAQRYLNR